MSSVWCDVVVVSVEGMVWYLLLVVVHWVCLILLNRVTAFFHLIKASFEPRDVVLYFVVYCSNLHFSQIRLEYLPLSSAGLTVLLWKFIDVIRAGFHSTALLVHLVFSVCVAILVASWRSFIFLCASLRSLIHWFFSFLSSSCMTFPSWAFFFVASLRLWWWGAVSSLRRPDQLFVFFWCCQWSRTVHHRQGRQLNRRGVVCAEVWLGHQFLTMSEDRGSRASDSMLHLNCFLIREWDHLFQILVPSFSREYFDFDLIKLYICLFVWSLIREHLRLMGWMFSSCFSLPLYKSVIIFLSWVKK